LTVNREDNRQFPGLFADEGRRMRTSSGQCKSFPQNITVTSG
jgi:hypothetical protein